MHSDQVLWNFLNYSPFFVLVLDNDMNIILGNFCLAKFIGFDSEDNLKSLNWTKFIPNDSHNIVSFVHGEIIDNSSKYIEFVSPIKSLSGETISVRWFNSKITNGVIGTFSIGIPLTKVVTPEDNIDNIRAYMRDIISQDTQTLYAIKDMVLKNS